MIDFLAIKICCLPGQGIVGATNAIVTKLPSELRSQFNNVFSSYLRRYGIEGLFERMNNRTIGSILADFETDNDSPLIEEGEIGNMRYRLFGPSSVKEKREGE